MHFDTQRIGWLGNLVLMIGCSADAEYAPHQSHGAASELRKAEPSTEPARIVPRVETVVLHQYDEAPRTPDADDPAIWVNPSDPTQSLIFGTLKDGGLQVYDLKGRVRQTVLPPNRPAVSASDPPVAGAQPDPGTTSCAESESGETFGRFNNVDVLQAVPLTIGSQSMVADIAVVSDRGCDRLRTYLIDPQRAGGPLIDITDPGAPRVFPQRLVQPSPVQSLGEMSGVIDNPLDDQNTAYGVALQRTDADGVHVFVTQRSRSAIAEVKLVASPAGVSYRRVREFRFDPIFDLGTRRSPLKWTPCREDPSDDPQFEGLVVDRDRQILYAAQEVVGLWRIPLRSSLPQIVSVPQSQLFERTRSFGLPYWAVPDDGEFSCETEEPSEAVPGTVFSAGDARAAGEHLTADAEGLAIYYTGQRSGYLVASSQGDDTFHVYDRQHVRRHLGSFRITGTGETDGHAVVSAPLGSDFPFGLFVSQNGEAEPPADTNPINDFEYDGSTRFELVGWENIALPLGLNVATR